MSIRIDILNEMISKLSTLKNYKTIKYGINQVQDTSTPAILINSYQETLEKEYYEAYNVSMYISVQLIKVVSPKDNIIDTSEAMLSEIINKLIFVDFTTCNEMILQSTDISEIDFNENIIKVTLNFVAKYTLTKED